MWMPPLGMSGKFGTPFVRMHLENANVELESLVEALDPAAPAVVLVLEDPQAATASTQPSAASAITGRVARLAHIAFMERMSATRF